MWQRGALWCRGSQGRVGRLRRQRKSQEVGFECGAFKCRTRSQQVLGENIAACRSRRKLAPSAFPSVTRGDGQDAISFRRFSLEPFAQITGGTENTHKSRVDRRIRERLLGRGAEKAVKLGGALGREILAAVDAEVLHERAVRGEGLEQLLRGGSIRLVVFWQFGRVVDGVLSPASFRDFCIECVNAVLRARPLSADADGAGQNDQTCDDDDEADDNSCGTGEDDSRDDSHSHNDNSGDRNEQRRQGIHEKVGKTLHTVNLSTDTRGTMGGRTDHLRGEGQLTHISVIGCGYLGAVHAAAMASVGHTVVGVDTDKQKLQKLENYQPPFFEPGLAELLEAGQADHSAGQEGADGTAQRLLFTSDISRAAEATVHFICVGTPQSKDSNAADMTYVNSAITDLMPHLKPGDLVVGKSTVPVGSAAELAKKIAPTGAKLAWNPEFLREGHAVEDTLRPDRIIYGVESGSEDDPAVAILDEVYAHNLGEEETTPRLIMDYQTAELVKTAANSFLATKISFINAMAELCETAGGAVAVRAEAIGRDQRIGRRFLNAGLGFGGGCLPKDIRAFIARADELGVEQAVSFLREVDSINLRRRARMVDLTREALGGDLTGKRITVLGIAFKPNTDDVRDSPALDVAERLEQAGAQVVITDPEAIENARLRDPELTYTPDLTEALTGADGVVLLTEWKQYKDLDPVAAGELVAQKVIVDGRNVVDRKAYRDAGWTVRGLGRQE